MKTLATTLLAATLAMLQILAALDRDSYDI